MKKFLVIVTIVLFYCSICFAGSFPKPAVGSGCGDDPWEAVGHWSNLQDSQYGAEVIDKGDKGFKLKVAKREGDMIIPYFCNYFDKSLTTEQLNEWYADGTAKFKPLPVKDSGNFKTVGFWIYR